MQINITYSRKKERKNAFKKYIFRSSIRPLSYPVPLDFEWYKHSYPASWDNPWITEAFGQIDLFVSSPAVPTKISLHTSCLLFVVNALCFAISFRTNFTVLNTEPYPWLGLKFCRISLQWLWVLLKYIFFNRNMVLTRKVKIV